MNKKLEIAFGFIVIIIVVVGFVVVGIATVPSSADVAKQRTVKNEDIKVPEDDLIGDLANKIKGFERNGNIPVQVNSTEIGRPNPFLPI